MLSLRPFRENCRVLRLGMMSAGGLVLAACSAACSAAHSPRTDASSAAQSFNVATRFGQMSAAAQQMAEDERATLLENRVQWGNGLRVVDIEVTAMELKTEDHAEVLVNVTWVRSDETVVRQTRIRQTWRNPAGDWQLTEESRADGANGLFGGSVVVLRPSRTRDVHLPSKTLSR